MRACCPTPILAATHSGTLQQMSQRLVALLFALISSMVLVTVLAGAAAAPSESRHEDAAARASYLYSFLGYIEWPSRTLPLTDTPLVIGVLNADDVAAELLLTTTGRKINDRAVTIRRLQPGERMDDIHLLYIGPGEPQQVQGLIRQVPQRWTVTVTDDGSAEALAGVINFRHSDGRLRFEVSQAAADRGDFKLSSRLMSVAIVQPGPN
jgi:YfiR/HmsC-like